MYKLCRNVQYKQKFKVVILRTVIILQGNHCFKCFINKFKQQEESFYNLKLFIKMWAKVNRRVDIQEQKKRNQHFEKQSSSSSDQHNSQNEEEQADTQKNNHYSYSESDSESQDDSLDRKRQEHQQRHEGDQTSSQSQASEQQSPKVKPSRKLESLKEESNEEQQSIDYIEERIRKLERDLQQRLDKHKSKIKQKTISNGDKSDEASGKIVSLKKQPLIPPKIKQAYQQEQENLLPQTQINFKPKQKKQYQNAQNGKEVGKQKISSYRKHIQAEEYSDSKNKHINQNDQEIGNMIAKSMSQSGNAVKKGSSKVSSPPRIAKKKMSKQVPKQLKSQIQMSKQSIIHEDTKKLSKQVAELKKQNKNLKQELSCYKKKKKPVEELVKLKELSEHDTKKLQKQLQLLQVLERLQTKLKNSIERKLGKGSAQNKMAKQAALLHKGLPSNIIN